MSYRLVEGKPAHKVVTAMNKIDRNNPLCIALMCAAGLLLGGLFGVGLNEIHPLF